MLREAAMIGECRAGHTVASMGQIQSTITFVFGLYSVLKKLLLESQCVKKKNIKLGISCFWKQGSLPNARPTLPPVTWLECLLTQNKGSPFRPRPLRQLVHLIPRHPVTGHSSLFLIADLHHSLK